VLLLSSIKGDVIDANNNCNTPDFTNRWFSTIEQGRRDCRGKVPKDVLED
jgi:hypothetical protein